ncbi:SH3 and multiple ankyrin repeat domains protein 1 [Merluccius polli]|uniref:SH3 and multiple ankyrin repeat domains protein 1 n=1 Tax=Merluccius polli TaxID=89951 RepID=A0AA47MAW9_MERPO|nr:SH3 and multiple ankyrin repeat domains protein 1 [Merluccius polli]
MISASKEGRKIGGDAGGGMNVFWFSTVDSSHDYGNTCWQYTTGLHVYTVALLVHHELKLMNRALIGPSIFQFLEDFNGIEARLPERQNVGRKWTSALRTCGELARAQGHVGTDTPLVTSLSRRASAFHRALLNSSGLLTMPRSPTSSEDEMAQSFSDYSDDSASNSSREETIYETIRATAPLLRMDDVHTHSLVVRVVIPDLQQTKCMRFNPDATVWVAKQQILCTLSQSLKDVLNYGLFQPASNGRDGKFLDEERILREYPQPISKGVPSLEFRYKSRVYRQPHVDEKQIAKLHTKANLRKFLELIQHHHVDKVSKMLERGLDPNYHDADTGETPLTLAAHLDDVMEVIKVLKNGGSHLDFRARDGMTALHKAARAKKPLTLTTLLELGASPDYKDSRGLTPLYHSVVVGGDPGCCELLLHYHAAVCCQDENGWHEVHQACRHGHGQHLEHLLFYGADMSAQNASGNTALHICALYNQDNCARVLLARGADKEVKNYNSQSPFQVKHSTQRTT